MHYGQVTIERSVVLLKKYYVEFPDFAASPWYLFYILVVSLSFLLPTHMAYLFFVSSSKALSDIT